MLRPSVIIFIILIITQLLYGCAGEPPSTPETQWISFEEAQISSQKDKKKILVNIYTNWCEFCKKLDENVYPDSLVRRNLSQYYHAVKLNAESDKMIRVNGETLSESEFAKKLGIRSYPTILFIDTDGELILQINGYMPASDFRNMLVYIGEEAYTKKEFHEFIADR